MYSTKSRNFQNNYFRGTIIFSAWDPLGAFFREKQFLSHPLFLAKNNSDPLISFIKLYPLIFQFHTPYDFSRILDPLNKSLEKLPVSLKFTNFVYRPLRYFPKNFRLLGKDSFLYVCKEEITLLFLKFSRSSCFLELFYILNCRARQYQGFK